MNPLLALRRLWIAFVRQTMFLVPRLRIRNDHRGHRTFPSRERRNNLDIVDSEAPLKNNEPHFPRSQTHTLGVVRFVS